MGAYTAHGVYKPAIFETGWGDAVNVNFDLLEEEIATGGGGGTSLGWVDSADHGTIGDGSDQTVALTETVEAATAGSALAYVRTGIYDWTAELANLVAGGFGLIGDGPGLTIFRVGADLGSDGLFSCLSRHGVPDADRIGPFLFQGFSIINPDRMYTGHAFNGFWQAKDVTWRDIYMEGLVGTGIGCVACLRPTIENVTMVDCGNGASGFAPVMWEANLEGGVTSGITEDGVINGLRVINPDDHGVRWMKTRDCGMTNSVLRGSGAYRSTFWGSDMDGCALTGNRVSDGADDCIHLQSSGDSRENVIVGNICRRDGSAGTPTPGTGYGINEYAANAEQVHTDNVIENNVGTVNRA